MLLWVCWGHSRVYKTMAKIQGSASHPLSCLGHGVQAGSWGTAAGAGSWWESLCVWVGITSRGILQQQV